jgi:hypothetical protein
MTQAATGEGRRPSHETIATTSAKLVQCARSGSLSARPVITSGAAWLPATFRHSCSNPANSAEAGDGQDDWEEHTELVRKAMNHTLPHPFPTYFPKQFPAGENARGSYWGTCTSGLALVEGLSYSEKSLSHLTRASPVKGSSHKCGGDDNAISVSSS